MNNQTNSFGSNSNEFTFLKHLFWSSEKPLSRGEYITAILLLFTISSAKFVGYFVETFSINSLEHIYSYSLYFAFLLPLNAGLFSIQVPWTIMMLAGSFLLSIRIFKPKTSWLITLLSGFFMYMFFFGLTSIPIYASFLEVLFRYEIQNKMLILLLFLSFGFLAGVVVLIVTFFSLKTNRESTEEKVVGFNRGKFSKWMLILTLSSLIYYALIVFILIKLTLDHFFSNPDQSVPIILLIFSLPILVIHLVLYTKRLKNARRSLLLLALIFLPLIALLLIFAAANWLLIFELTFLIAVLETTVNASFLFLLWLYIAPSREEVANSET
ncbi:hypothetical protein [Natronoflexus pectinivorans]|uniref:Uncharacterized protein n=1 Tax=Natronoflexus pectinivorans TaxID=682526 RepID=A0A4R2GIW2_9BACT|nr:hypothetical protein [Natronoflexus pectinivorans]TCO08233.1 hypothetical protein EV194_10535 [Natronoflexus pectinivorans]